MTVVAMRVGRRGVNQKRGIVVRKITVVGGLCLETKGELVHIAVIDEHPLSENVSTD